MHQCASKVRAYEQHPAIAFNIDLTLKPIATPASYVKLASSVFTCLRLLVNVPAPGRSSWILVHPPAGRGSYSYCLLGADLFAGKG